MTNDYIFIIELTHGLIRKLISFNTDKNYNNDIMHLQYYLNIY